MESLRPTSELTHNETNELGDSLMESLSTKWTDEKHSLYLDNMEASFVSQLYSSMDVQAPRKTQLDSCSTDEFKVLHNGCWQKINYPRNEPINRADEASSLRRNPWIQHYKSAGKPQVVTPLVAQESSQPRCEAINIKAKASLLVGSTSMQKSSQVFHRNFCNQDTSGSNKEVSDQNFTDDNFMEEKTNGFHNLKRLRT